MTRPRHICILTTAHPVDDVRVNTKFAASFLEHGFDVSWVGPAVAHFGPRTDPGDGIAYVPVEPAMSRRERPWMARRVGLGARLVKDVDWWYSPDPDGAEAMLRVAARQGGKTLFDVHEVFHAGHLDRWLFGLRARPVRELVRRRVAHACSRADLVTGVSEVVLRPFVGDSAGAVVVRNCAPAWFATGALPPDRTSGRLRVMHGKAEAGNGTPVVLEALQAHADDTEGVTVLMTRTRSTPADMAADMEAAAREARIETSPPRSHAEMPQILSGCSVGMVTYGRDLGVDSLPNRLFEYMAAGLAVLAPSYSIEIRRIVETEHIGVTADFEDPHDVARALAWLRDHPEEVAAMGRRARAAFLERHNWEGEFSRLIMRMEEEA